MQSIVIGGITKEEYEKAYNYTNAYHPEINNGTTQTNFTEYNTWEYFCVYDLVGSSTIRPRSIEIKMLFGPLDDDAEGDTFYYFLASSVVSNNDWYGACFDVYCVVTDEVLGGGEVSMFRSQGNNASYGCYVRPVIILNSGVQLERGANVNGVAGYKIK